MFSSKSFCLMKYHFEEADRIRMTCDYRIKSTGKLMFPNFLEVDSRKVKGLMSAIPMLRDKFPKMYLVPWSAFDVMEERE